VRKGESLPWPRSAREKRSREFDKGKVESAVYHLTSFEGQMTYNPPPLAKVMFREGVRPLLWMLVGPPPEKKDAFWRHPDGTPIERPKEDGKIEQTQDELAKKLKTRQDRGR
jgi:hypothetical protein